jgi:hypothetical protein
LKWHAAKGKWVEQLPDMALAEQLMRSCYEMYRQVPTGIAPDAVIFTVQDAAVPKKESGVRFQIAATLPSCVGPKLPNSGMQGRH